MKPPSGPPGRGPRDRSGPRRPRPAPGRPASRNKRRRDEPPDPRLIALEVLTAVESEGAYSDLRLEKAFARHPLERRDRDLVTALVQDTLRRRGTIDWLIRRALHIELDSLPVRMRNVLRLGVYQLFFMDRIPAHAAVNESVRLARRFGHPGTVGLVNAVLRRLADYEGRMPGTEGLPPAEALAVRVSHPMWLLDRWIARFGEEGAASLAEANNRPVRLTLRANRARTDVESLIAALQREGVSAKRSRWHADSVEIESGFAPSLSAAFRSGLAVVQDAAESLVGLLVEARPGARVADLCAAPGAKATHLAERVGARGVVVATDVVFTRAAKIREAASRLSLPALCVVTADVVHYPSRERFDSVLLDAPCSGLGVLGRRADARWRKSPESIARAATLQSVLIEAASARVRAGGTLVYSVCSLEPEEGPDIVRAFLEKHGGFELESVRGLVPDEMVSAEGTLLALPHVHGTDGVFGARLRRKGKD